MIYTVDENHVYHDENGVPFNGPSVTGILDSVGIVDFSAVPEERLKFKREIGDAVHFACRYRDLDQLDYSTVQPQWANYLVAYENFLEETGFVPEEVEQSGIHEISGMRFSYTRDRVGRFPGFKHRVVLELKCTYKEEPSWKVQLAAYEMTVPKAENEFVARIAVQLKPDQTYKIYPDINGYQDTNDRKVFLWSLCVVNFKITNNIQWQKSKGEL
jgi:hypothetical protein